MGAAGLSPPSPPHFNHCFYDIWPGNGAVLFFHPRARTWQMTYAPGWRNALYGDRYLHAFDGADQCGFTMQLLIGPDRAMTARQQRSLGGAGDHITVGLRATQHHLTVGQFHCRGTNSSISLSGSFRKFLYQPEGHRVEHNLFPGGPGLAGTRMSPFWISFELRMMKMVVTTAAIRPAKENPSFYRPCALPVAQPTVSEQ